MSDKTYPSHFLALLKSIKSKRPRTVIQHILEYGQITTEDLKNIYGYNHPPRAIRDVREQGIPIETFRVTNSDGRSIAAYKFGDPSQIRATQLSGRTAFSSKLKARLIEKQGMCCAIYLESFPETSLQIDHHIPFEIGGENTDSPNEYMLLCASANRKKSWSCQHCQNWVLKNIDNCLSCYWAYPESYQHIAMQKIHRTDIIWTGDEVAEYKKLKNAAKQTKQSIPSYIKQLLYKHLNKK